MTAPLTIPDKRFVLQTVVVAASPRCEDEATFTISPSSQVLVEKINAHQADGYRLASSPFWEGANLCVLMSKEVEVRPDEDPPQYKTYTFTVNGIPRVIAGANISYEELVRLANLEEGPMYSLVYKKADGKAGTLTPGQTVALGDHMYVTVMLTGSA